MYINKSKKIVIKIGSSILVDGNGNVRKKWLNEFSKDILELIDQNKFESPTLKKEMSTKNFK